MNKHQDNLASNLQQRLDQEHPTSSTVKAPAVQLLLLLHSGKLCAWQIMQNLPPKTLLIKGEAQLTVRDATTLGSAWEDLTACLHDDGLNTDQALWVADSQGRQWCTAQKLADWQLPWEWLVQRFGLGDTTPWDIQETSWQTQILPWLIATDDVAQRQQLRQARELEHASETERLTAERAALEQENERLRIQNAALQQVDADRLVSFLPALFPRVFTVIGPSDLALLCGRIEPLPLPNPYPEPVEETLRSLQKRFRALPQVLQKQIVSFVTNLPHSQRLQPRPEMRELVEALKDN